MEITAIQSIRNEINPYLPGGYELNCMIAESSMGGIYTAVSPTTGHFLAIKTIKTIFNESLKYKIKLECDIVKKLKHQNIYNLFGFKDTGFYTIICMELLTGGDLFDRIPVGKGINMIQAYTIYADLLSAVEYCHKFNIVHMDIKPENVMMSAHLKPKLIDFGLAIDHNVTPLIYGYLGTHPYSAPETFEDSPYTGYKADLFSLNITFLTVITGERCWAKAKLNDVNYKDWYDRRWTLDAFKRIPADLLDFLSLALAHDPEQRLSIEQIRSHIWFKSGSKGRIKALKTPSESVNLHEAPKSQPSIANLKALIGSAEIPLSQPLDLSSILMPAVGDDHQIVKRMTRFFSKKGPVETLHILAIIIGQEQNCHITTNSSNSLNVESFSAGFSVMFRVFVYLFGGSTLVDFRRLRGDGLLFRNTFVNIKNAAVMLKLECTDNEYLKKLQPSV